MRAAKVMAAGLPGGASLMKDYTYDLTPGGELILGAHMLEVCPSLSSAKPTLEIHPLGIGGKDDPVRLVFTADAGPAVVVALSDMRDRFRLVANVVDVVEPPHPLPKLPVGRAGSEVALGVSGCHAPFLPPRARLSGAPWEKWRVAALRLSTNYTVANVARLR